MSNKQNIEITVLPSELRTVTYTTEPLTNYEYRGIRLFLNITTAASGTLDIKLQELVIFAGSATWLDITGAAFAQKSGTGADDLVIYPGITATANRRVNDVLPKTWRVVSTLASTPSFTYSLGGCYIS